MAQTYSFPGQKNKNILILDIGTTGVKAFVFDAGLNPISRVYQPLNKFFPGPGWVEQSPMEILRTSQKILRQAVKKSRRPPKSFIGFGLTNQRETTIVWREKTGRPVYPAIVWEDNRTAAFCRDLAKKFNRTAQNKTGLTIDPYFSASKIRWILKNVKAARALAEKGELLFGTVDSWLMWNFLEGRPHLIDRTNAGRTLLFDIKKRKWDKEMLKMFFDREAASVSRMLPQAKPSVDFFGRLKKDILGFRLPLLAVCGDQQASLAAAQYLKKTGLLRPAPHITKITYGTGTFIMQILGPRFQIREPFFTTLAATAGKPLYVLEYKIACCGKKVEPLLGRPEKLRPIVKNLAEQIRRYLRKLPVRPAELIVDGGVSRLPELIEEQEKSSSLPVIKQKIYDGTALGAAWLAKESAGQRPRCS